jgi:hypothetical protein
MRAKLIILAAWLALLGVMVMQPAVGQMQMMMGIGQPSSGAASSGGGGGGCSGGFLDFSQACNSALTMVVGL